MFLWTNPWQHKDLWRINWSSRQNDFLLCHDDMFPVIFDKWYPYCFFVFDQDLKILFRMYNLGSITIYYANKYIMNIVWRTIHKMLVLKLHNNVLMPVYLKKKIKWKIIKTIQTILQLWTSHLSHLFLSIYKKQFLKKSLKTPINTQHVIIYFPYFSNIGTDGHM